MRNFKFLDIVIFLVVLLFLYAAVAKLKDYTLFESQISKSPLISEHAKWIAVVVPTAEILIAIMLLIPRVQIVGLYLSYTLMFLFTIYIAFILTFSPYVPCSCGGILEDMTWTTHLIFNIGYTILIVFGIRDYYRVTKGSPIENVNPHDIAIKKANQI